jgi:ATP-dependent Clp protease ATP-binding subunit ClpC
MTVEREDLLAVTSGPVAVAAHDFELAAHRRDQADQLKKRKAALLREWLERAGDVSGTVDREAVAAVVGQMTYTADEPF